MDTRVRGSMSRTCPHCAEECATQAPLLEDPRARPNEGRRLGEVADHRAQQGPARENPGLDRIGPRFDPIASVCFPMQGPAYAPNMRTRDRRARYLRTTALPIIAASGGIVGPATVYIAVALGSSSVHRSGVLMATAFDRHPHVSGSPAVACERAHGTGKDPRSATARTLKTHVCT